MAPDSFPHDAAYKTFFSNPEMVKSLLLDFVPEDFVRDFDFATLEQCAGSYTTVDLQERHDDIVWRVRWKGNWCYIYILLEFQSTQDYWMALRILAYTALLWQDLVKKGVVRQGEKLPPVLPIVIYNGDRQWTAPVKVQDLVSHCDDKLSDYQPGQKYFLIDENRLSRFLLGAARGESAYIFRLEQAESADEVLTLAHEISQRLGKPEYDFLRRSIYSWITRLLKKKAANFSTTQTDTVETVAMLETRIAQWEQELLQKGMVLGKEEGRLLGKEEGLLQGKEEGILLGKAEGILLGKEEGRLLGEARGIANQKETLLDMLADRFGSIPPEWQTAINLLSDPATISQLTRAILKVKSPNEYGKLLASTNTN